MDENNEIEKNLNEGEKAGVREDFSEPENFNDNAKTAASVKANDDVIYKSKSREMFEWVASILIALVIALVLRNYVVTFVKVYGTSMVPTLQNNERLIVVRLGYQPKAGDIIILNPPVGRGPYVKRIIGMPGQTVSIDNATGNVYIDGVLQDEPYINNMTTSNKSQFIVPEKCVFVMGDNRGSSHDSRSSDVGFIPFESVLGRAVFRVWPFTRFGLMQ